jgi:ketosteroid isomerase-like protein
MEKAESSTDMAAPAPSGKKMSVEGTLKDNENRWAAAAAKHDVKAVEAMVADDYMGVNSKGKMQSRRAMLGELKGDKNTYTSARNEKLEVRKYGANVAVVVGVYREKGTGKDGKAFDRSYRFTDTWVERNGQWKCVAGQAMLLGKR